VVLRFESVLAAVMRENEEVHRLPLGMPERTVA
jgi:hypothetical protein